MAPTISRASPEFYFLSAVHRIKYVKNDPGAEAYFKYLESCLEELNWDVTVKATYTRILQGAKAHAQADLKSKERENRSKAYSTASNAVIMASVALESPLSHRSHAVNLTHRSLSESESSLSRMATLDSRAMLLGGPHQPLDDAGMTSFTSAPTMDGAVIGESARDKVREKQDEPVTQVNEREALLGPATTPSRGRTNARMNFPDTTEDSQRQNLETDLLDLAQEMKGVAGKFGVTIEKNKKVMDDMGNLVDSNADRIKGENTTARKLLKSNTLSFFKTMIMLIVSIIMFSVMVPFIFATSIIN